MKHIFTTLLCLASLISVPVSAQDAIPDMPEAIKNLALEGAQIRYMGDDYGVDGWMAIKSGQVQYMYVLPGGEAFLMGVLFDKNGKIVTGDQVKRLQGNDTGLLDALSENKPSASSNDDFSYKTPAEQMFAEIESSNWVPLGSPNAPIAYAFIDPQCPHCHAFIKDVKGDIDAGKLQLRLVPVGLTDETRAQAAFLIATPDPQGRWFKHMEGDEKALPAKSDINDQGVQRNMAIMQSWKFKATPMIIYRGRDNSVKLVRGRPKNPKTVIQDLAIKG